MFSNLWRETSEEKRELQRLHDDMINDVRQCAEVHRQVRSYMSKIVQPGIKLIDMCETLEDSVCKLIKKRGLEAGIAFPTGCSLDWVAAHWTPNSGDKTVLTYDSVMKLGEPSSVPLASTLFSWPCEQLDQCFFQRAPL
jgi:methionyl aminopeptidase